MADGQFLLVDFVRESNRIEGILRDPMPEEVRETQTFVDLPKIEIWNLKNLVEVCAPGHRLRDKTGLNVRVGNYIAPAGGPAIGTALHAILDGDDDPWRQHLAYDTLHPFTDGNGRSGRALWLWQMTRQFGGAPLGFLHHFYYQTLERSSALTAAEQRGYARGVSDAAAAATAMREIIPMWDRPGGPPGNGPKRPATPDEIAAAILQLKDGGK